MTYTIQMKMYSMLWWSRSCARAHFSTSL